MFGYLLSYVHMNTGAHWGIGFLDLELQGSCELGKVGAENWTQILWMRSKFFNHWVILQPLSLGSI